LPGRTSNRFSSRARKFAKPQKLSRHRIPVPFPSSPSENLAKKLAILMPYIAHF
jgi:hypothetical protein